MLPKVITITLNPSLDKTVVVDTIEEGSVNRIKQVRFDAGGKGINVARLLASFQVNVKALGYAGGRDGEQLLKILEEAKINAEFIPVEDRTRSNLKIFAEDTSITTELNEPGANVNMQEAEQFRQVLEKELRDASYLVLGGSVPPGVSSSIYGDYIRFAEQMGVKTVLDADGEALKEGLKAKPYAVKPNIHELQQWLGRELRTEEEVIAGAREILQLGTSLVIVSMGGDGALFVSHDEVYRTKPFPIKVQSTVGAGDSMVAVLIYALIQGKQLKEIAAWTTAAGTITASKEGTQMCSLKEVSQKYNDVEVIHITNLVTKANPKTGEIIDG